MIKGKLGIMKQVSWSAVFFALAGTGCWYGHPATAVAGPGACDSTVGAGSAECSQEATTELQAAVAAAAMGSGPTSSAPAIPDINVQVAGSTVLTGGSYDYVNFCDGGSGVAFTIQNTGTGSLQLVATPAALTGGTSFNILSQPGTLLLQPGASTTFPITRIFGSGGLSDTLTITSNDPDESTYTITILGTVMCG